MQKLVKRTVQAQRQVARRMQKDGKKERMEVRKRHETSLKAANKEIRENLRNARRARREDWEMGPLAPKRDLGFNNYGTVKENLRADWSNNGVSIARPDVMAKRCAWAGGVKQLCLAPGDRIVILDGPDKGKLDRIKAINAKHGSVTLETNNQGLMSSWIDTKPYGTPMPISVASIRLVYPLTNPETGVTKDTMINQLKAIPPNMQSENMSLDRWEFGNKWDRVIPGLNVVIPWPEVEVPKYEAKDADTPREKVEDRTFYYNLISPPMPVQIIDELRNKYSKFRTRHEPAYIAKKEAEEALKNGNRMLLQSMMTPLDEFHAKQREIKEARGELVLSEDMLEKIGEIIAKTKAVNLENAGATEEAPKDTPPQQTI